MAKLSSLNLCFSCLSWSLIAHKGHTALAFFSMLTFDQRRVHWGINSSIPSLRSQHINVLTLKLTPQGIIDCLDHSGRDRLDHVNGLGKAEGEVWEVLTKLRYRKKRSTKVEKIGWRGKVWKVLMRPASFRSTGWMGTKAEAGAGGDGLWPFQSASSLLTKLYTCKGWTVSISSKCFKCILAYKFIVHRFCQSPEPLPMWGDKKRAADFAEISLCNKRSNPRHYPTGFT